MKYIILFLALLIASPAAARECGKPVSAVGKANIVTGVARESAIAAWERTVKFSKGARWATWDYSEKVDVLCEPAGGAIAMERCKAVARPCRKVGQ